MINNMINEEKVFFSPGQRVTLRQEIENKPTMIVHRVERNIIRSREGGGELLRGIKCRWFTKDGFLQEAVFSTKDLQLID